MAAFQGGTDDFPSRRIDHEGNSRHLGVGSEKTQEMHHLAFGVKKSIVEVDVEHLGIVNNRTHIAILIRCLGKREKAIHTSDEIGIDLNLRDILLQ